MEIVVAMFIVGAVVLAAGAVSKDKRTTQLKAIGGLLGGGQDGKGHAWGDAFGIMADLRFVTRGSGSSSETWTEIDVELPSRYPFSLLLRRQGWLDARKIEKGEMVDVEVGDQAFDDAFLVEAAPADVIRKLLTDEVRKLFFGLPRFQLMTVPNKATLRLELRGWTAVEVVGDATTILAHIANGLREAYAQVEAESHAVIGGSPFRQEIDDRPVRAAAEARELEVSRVELVRLERQQNQKVIRGAIAICVTIAAILMMLAR